MYDEVMIRITRDLTDVLFENGERANFKEGELVRARVEYKSYGEIAHINYG